MTVATDKKSMVNMVQDAVRHDVDRTEAIDLPPAEQEYIARVLLSPPVPPNPALEQALANHKEWLAHE